MDERCFRPLLCTVKAELGRGQPGQILRRLWGLEYLAYLAQMAILFFVCRTEKFLMGAGVALF